MNANERAILSSQTSGKEPKLSVRSSTRIDAGLWWRRSRLWVCVMEQDVVILAAARRHYIQRFPIADCQASHYCHTTGELIIEAGEDLQFKRLRMSPKDALRVLRALGATNTMNTMNTEIPQGENLNHSENSCA